MIMFRSMALTALFLHILSSRKNSSTLTSICELVV